MKATPNLLAAAMAGIKSELDGGTLFYFAGPVPADAGDALDMVLDRRREGRHRRQPDRLELGRVVHQQGGRHGLQSGVLNAVVHRRAACASGRPLCCSKGLIRFPPHI